MTKFNLTEEDLKDIPKERLDKAWEEYDKYEIMIQNYDKVESYPPPNKIRPTVGDVWNALVKVSVVSFFAGSLITIAVGGTLILSLLERI